MFDDIALSTSTYNLLLQWFTLLLLHLKKYLDFSGVVVFFWGDGYIKVAVTPPMLIYILGFPYNDFSTLRISVFKEF